MISLHSEEELLGHLCKFQAIVHISAFGNRMQFVNVDAAVQAAAVPLFEASDSLDSMFGKGNWVACFGGDPLNESKPTTELEARESLENILECPFRFVYFR